jgi:hypothetical protein
VVRNYHEIPPRRGGISWSSCRVPKYVQTVEQHSRGSVCKFSITAGFGVLREAANFLATRLVRAANTSNSHDCRDSTRPHIRPWRPYHANAAGREACYRPGSASPKIHCTNRAFGIRGLRRRLHKGRIWSASDWRNRESCSRPTLGDRRRCHYCPPASFLDHTLCVRGRWLVHGGAGFVEQRHEHRSRFLRSVPRLRLAASDSPARVALCARSRRVDPPD